MGNKIVIPYRVYSRNYIDKQHWSKKQKLKQYYQVLIRNQMRRGGHQQVLDHQIVDKIIIKAYLKRLYDEDNLIGGAKQLIDALHIEKFIWDDAPKYLNNLEIKQIKVNVDPYTTIERYFPT